MRDESTAQPSVFIQMHVHTQTFSTHNSVVGKPQTVKKNLGLGVFKHMDTLCSL